jgi:DNA repair protein RadC
MMTQLDLFAWKPKVMRSRKPKGACEWKIVSLRETATDELPCCIKPEDAVQYWRKHIATAPHFNPDCECFAVLLLNVRQRIRGHHLVSIGSLNEAMAHPREVFRAAVIGAAWGVVLMHNHPSGDPSPSDADIRMTRRLADCGRTLQITVCDHVIIGDTRHLSLRESGIIQ